jgi:branched-chain amino acid transport system ATP-binding protein
LLQNIFPPVLLSSSATADILITGILDCRCYPVNLHGFRETEPGAINSLNKLNTILRPRPTNFTVRANSRAGVVQVLEGHRVFTALTVEDNLPIGTYARSPHGGRSKPGRIYELFPELGEKRDDLSSRLSGEWQQILAVAQGVIGEPRLLILDEPSAGLAPMVIDRILSVAAELCKGAMAIVLVEQLVEKALRHAGYCYLVETARIAAAGTPKEIQASDVLHQTYLGGHAAAKN